MGNLYQDYLHLYAKAENSYLKAIEIEGGNSIYIHNLVFLYRDRMGDVEKAKLYFNKIEKKEKFEYIIHIQNSLFAMHDKNLGVAAIELEGALKITSNELPLEFQYIWWCFAATSHNLGYSHEVLTTMEKTGHNIVLRPFYEAIKTLAEGTKDYLNSVAVEVREPAKSILEKIVRIGNITSIG